MGKADIIITSWNHITRGFENYDCYFFVEKGGGAERHCADMKELAQEILFCVAESNEDPNYKIRLSEGIHPLRKCEKDCAHYRYTQSPDIKLRDELLKYLNDSELINEAKESFKRFRENPPKITFCSLDEMLK